MKLIGKFQAIDQGRRPGSTVVKLVLNVGNEMTGIVIEKASWIVQISLN